MPFQVGIGSVSGTVFFQVGFGIPLRTMVLRKRCSEIMQQIYRRTHMRKCDFNKFAAYFENTFS